MSAVLNHQGSVHSVPAQLEVNLTDPLAAANQRLTQSRQRLQIAVAEAIDAKRPQVGTAGHAPPAWLHQLQSIPGVGTVLQALTLWWAKHPLHAVSATALDAANSVAKPVAARHPVPMLLAAAALGGVLVWSRPWRWILKPALFAGLVARVSSKLITQVPMQSWMTLLTAFTQGRTAAEKPTGSDEANNAKR